MIWIAGIILVYLFYKEWNYWIYEIGIDEGGLYVKYLKRYDKIPNVYVGYNIGKFYFKNLFKKKKDLF